MRKIRRMPLGTALGYACAQRSATTVAPFELWCKPQPVGGWRLSSFAYKPRCTGQYGAFWLRRFISLLSLSRRQLHQPLKSLLVVVSFQALFTSFVYKLCVPALRTSSANKPWGTGQCGVCRLRRLVFLLSLSRRQLHPPLKSLMVVVGSQARYKPCGTRQYGAFRLRRLVSLLSLQPLSRS